MARKKKKTEIIGKGKIDLNDVTEFLQIMENLKYTRARQIAKGIMEYFYDSILHGYAIELDGIGTVGVALTPHVYPKLYRNPRTGEKVMSKDKYERPYLTLIPVRSLSLKLKSMTEENVDGIIFEDYTKDFGYSELFVENLQEAGE